MEIASFLGISITGEVSLGDLLVAAGTLALAVFTWRLARATSSSLGLTRDGLELARESNEASDRPWVIPSPDQDGRLQVLTNHGSSQFAFRLWNIGRGPAIVVEVSLSHPDGSELLAIERGLERPVATSLPVRDELVDLVRNPPPEGAELRLRIRYRGPTGAVYETHTEATVQKHCHLLCRGYRRTSLA